MFSGSSRRTVELQATKAIEYWEVTGPFFRTLEVGSVWISAAWLVKIWDADATKSSELRINGSV